MMASKRRSEEERMKHMRGYDFVVSVYWGEDGDEQPGDNVRDYHG